MIVNGIKWACATCIKGHRASHCNHEDRPLIEVKKKGRPATQCKRCRELRTVRQLHVRCDCNNETERSSNLRSRKKARNDRETKSSKKSTTEPFNSKELLRSIAPKPKVPLRDPSFIPLNTHIQIPSSLSCCPSNASTANSSSLHFSETSSPCSEPFTSIQSPPIMNLQPSISPVSTCCSKQPSTETLSTPVTPTSIVSAAATTIPVRQNAGAHHHPTPESFDASTPCESPTVERVAQGASCCSTEKVTSSGERIRVVTCRCGDSCTCVGCDAHPSRAMKSKVDPYAGFAIEEYNPRRRLSIAAICAPSDAPTPKLAPGEGRPTSLLAEDGSLLCGCGCSQSFDACSNCFTQLCDDYYADSLMSLSR